MTEPVTGFRVGKGEGFIAQFRFNPLAQGAHLTGSNKLLTRPIRSASALFGGFALRFCAFFLSSRVVVSSLSFPSFPSVLCSCLLLLFLFVSLVCLSVGVSVCWCVASLGWVPFRSVALPSASCCVCVAGRPAMPATMASGWDRVRVWSSGISSAGANARALDIWLGAVVGVVWGLYSAGSRARRGSPSHTVCFCAPGACTARF